MTESAPEPAPANEIAEAAQRAKEVAAGARQSGRWPLTGIALGVGVGSAAIAAALLYANWGRGKKD